MFDLRNILVKINNGITDSKRGLATYTHGNVRSVMLENGTQNQYTETGRDSMHEDRSSYNIG